MTLFFRPGTPNNINRRLRRARAGLILVGVVLAPSATMAADPGRYCLREWPNDRDSFLLCQHLQNRNQLEFKNFLTQNGLNENDLVHGHEHGGATARAARYCLKRWSPDYQEIWSCTQRRTRGE